MIWSAAEIDYLSQNIEQGADTIAKTLNRSYSSVVQKAYIMRLSFTGRTLKNVAYTKRSRDSQNKAPWKSDLPPFHKVMLGLYPNAIHAKRKLWRRRRAIILKMHDDACYYCGDPANTVDHIKPRHLGGTDHINNLVAACVDCNSGWIQQISWRDKYYKKRLQGA
jgi:5-methylcytosine-specific restriction endonuclease McrA